MMSTRIILFLAALAIAIAALGSIYGRGRWVGKENERVDFNGDIRNWNHDQQRRANAKNRDTARGEVLKSKSLGEDGQKWSD